MWFSSIGMRLIADIAVPPAVCCKAACTKAGQIVENVEIPKRNSCRQERAARECRKTVEITIHFKGWRANVDWEKKVIFDEIYIFPTKNGCRQECRQECFWKCGENNIASEENKARDTSAKTVVAKLSPRF